MKEILKHAPDMAHYSNREGCAAQPNKASSLIDERGIPFIGELSLTGGDDRSVRAVLFLSIRIATPRNDEDQHRSSA
ncbi:hypothetical protein [Mesorhizobium sp. SARCC-RB16n]|uniref:hypothetical protein n=1 Tax=Mesorhizobium sp. SARCC-RB16n TaxID=2116687 RepID=UPI00122F82F6|nr:hypothetical protein [Mesorhizobium sp. SARCC-RB16n]